MPRLLLALIFSSSLIVPLLAQAVTATYTLTVAERAAVDTLVAVENARRAALTPPDKPITAQQYANVSCRAPFKDYADQADEQAAIETAVKDRWKRASPAQRAAALGQLPPD